MKAVIFDLDDTLYPEVAFVQSGFRAVAAWIAERWPHDPEDVATSLWRLYQAGVRGNTFAVWLASVSDMASDLEAELVQLYRTHRPQIVPFCDARLILDRLQQRYLLGLVSDGFLQVQRNKLAALELAPYFRAILFSDELGRDNWKPSPLPFQTVLGRLGTAPTEAVYIADNVGKDFLAPRQLGMGTIQIRRPDSVYAELHPSTPLHAAHHVVSDLTSLCSVLQDFPW